MRVFWFSNADRSVQLFNDDLSRIGAELNNFRGATWSSTVFSTMEQHPLDTHLVYCKSRRMRCVRGRTAGGRDHARGRWLRDFLAIFRWRDSL